MSNKPHPDPTPDTNTFFSLPRYELQFAVSDRVWGQTNVAANVTVAVRLLSPDALGHAAAVILTPTTPEQFAEGWTPLVS